MCWWDVKSDLTYSLTSGSFYDIFTILFSQLDPHPLGHGKQMSCLAHQRQNCQQTLAGLEKIICLGLDKISRFLVKKKSSGALCI